MNAQLQARAGRNSPQQVLDVSFNKAKGYVFRLAVTAAPGSDVKIAEGGNALLNPDGLTVFLGENAGAAEITVTATIQDPNGLVVFTTSDTLGPGGNESIFLSPESLPEGYSLWLNATLTAGVYGDDAVAQYSLVESTFLPVGPTNIETALTTVQEAPPGHCIILGFASSVLYNTDSIDHDFETYLTTEAGIDFLIHAGTVVAGDSSQPLGGGAFLNPGDKLRVKILLPIATAGRSVTVYGLAFETNEQND